MTIKLPSVLYTLNKDGTRNIKEGDNMKLPGMKYAEDIRRTVQVKFGGMNHTKACGDGEIYDMKNLTSLYFPLLASRPKRYLTATLTKPNGLYGRDKLCWVDGTSFYYDGVSEGTVLDSFKTFTALGAYIIILPDKKYYNTVTDTFGDLESAYTGGITFQDGTLYGEAATANTIYAATVTWSTYFKVGDGVTISGCTVHTENNKTPIIREIDDTAHTMSFYENVFTNGTETNVTIERAMPDMDFICENENRLWGCKGDTIYASKLGDPFNWNVFDGLSTDSYSVDVGSGGDFTGCFAYLGYPVFFKENNVYKVYGNIPKNFEVMGSATLGVRDGSEFSFAVAGETLFFHTRAGIAAYSGGMPTIIADVFGTELYTDAVGGSDGLKYYVSMKDSANAWHLFTFDASKGVWHREDDSHALSFAYADRNLYMLASDGKLWAIGNATAPTGSSAESSVTWYAEFGDFIDDSPHKKGVSKILIRAELDASSSLQVDMKFDSDSAWTTVKNITSTDKQSYSIYIIPKRADRYKLKLSGAGGCRVYSIAREFYHGSDR